MATHPPNRVQRHAGHAGSSLVQPKDEDKKVCCAARRTEVVLRYANGVFIKSGYAQFHGLFVTVRRIAFLDGAWISHGHRHVHHRRMGGCGGVAGSAVAGAAGVSGGRFCHRAAWFQNNHQRS